MRILQRSFVTSLIAFGLVAFCGALQAAESTGSMYKPAFAAPGGLSPLPQMFPPLEVPGGVRLEWRGLTPPYQVQGAAEAGDPVWVNIGEPLSAETLTVPADEAVSVFRVRAAEPGYLGEGVCVFCHQNVHGGWAGSSHARALEPLKGLGQEGNPSCLPCHTVGYGYATGFQSVESTPEKGSVQCENCHGPGGHHVANITDPSLRPKVTLASANCGGCHNYEYVHRTYDEWLASKHTKVTSGVAARIESQGEPAMKECGACHSGAVRLALLDQWKRAQASPGAEAHLPSREDATYFAVDCAVCHEPHAQAAPGGLRNPLNSVADYSFDPDLPFATQYDPDINLCGQCHNQRGASWEQTSRPPHRSPQYNMLVGTAGYDPDETGLLVTHSRLEGQCVFCHSEGYGNGSFAKNPDYLGHTTGVNYEKCSTCHGSVETAKLLRDFVQGLVRDGVADVVASLNTWAETRAPADLRERYGRLAWEYTHVGDLSNPSGEAGLSGPTAEEQTRVPEAIKQARLNVYLVDRDGSYGVHNAHYALHLLEVAKKRVAAAGETP